MMFKPYPVLSLLLLCSAAGAPTGDETDALIQKYFKAQDDAGRDSILVELKKYEKTQVAPENLFKLAKEGTKSEGKKQNKLAHKDYAGDYLIAGTTSGKKLPLYIGLHAGGDTSKYTGADALKLGFPKGCLAVFPTVLVRPATVEWNTEKEGQYVLALIEEIKRSYDIDTNRIYLSGFSMGGWGTFCIGSHYADQFAALAPGAGGTMEAYVHQEKCSIWANLRNTPIRFFNGEKDFKPPPTDQYVGARNAAKKLDEFQKEHGGYEHQYTEYPGKGHDAPPDGFGPIYEWMAKHKRDPYPAKVIWEPHRTHYRYFYWLKVKTPAPKTRIEAEIDKSKNTITLKTKGVTSDFTIFLNKEMVDLSKPVKLMLNGEEKFSGTVAPSLTALVETIAAKRDPEMYFTHRIDF